MQNTTRLLSVAALAFLTACSHAANTSNNDGEATSAVTPAASGSATATPASTTAASSPAIEATGGGMTYKTDKGSVTIGGAIDPAKLGAPVYPGMTQDAGSAYQVTNSNGSAVATYKTGDTFDKVYGYYKAHLPADAEVLKTPQMAEFVTKADSSNVTIMVESKPDGTVILIGRGAASQ